MVKYVLGLFFLISSIQLHAEQENFLEHRWIQRYFSAPEKGTIEETIDFLLAMKLDLFAKGVSLPNLSSLLLKVQEILDAQGILIEKEEIDAIYELLLAREKNFYSSLVGQGTFVFAKNQSVEPSDGEESVSLTTIFGIVKVLAGVICCIVPSAHAVETGVFLIGDGVRDIANSFADREVVHESAGLPLK